MYNWLPEIREIFNKAFRFSGHPVYNFFLCFLVRYSRGLTYW